jgi:hypothetical protein
MMLIAQALWAKNDADADSALYNTPVDPLGKYSPGVGTQYPMQSGGGNYPMYGHVSHGSA